MQGSELNEDHGFWSDQDNKLEGFDDNLEEGYAPADNYEPTHQPQPAQLNDQPQTLDSTVAYDGSLESNHPQAQSSNEFTDPERTAVLTEAQNEADSPDAWFDKQSGDDLFQEENAENFESENFESATIATSQQDPEVGAAVDETAHHNVDQGLDDDWQKSISPGYTQHPGLASDSRLNEETEQVPESSPSVATSQSQLRPDGEPDVSQSAFDLVLDFDDDDDFLDENEDVPPFPLEDNPTVEDANITKVPGAGRPASLLLNFSDDDEFLSDDFDQHLAVESEPPSQRQPQVDMTSAISQDITSSVESSQESTPAPADSKAEKKTVMSRFNTASNGFDLPLEVIPRKRAVKHAAPVVTAATKLQLSPNSFAKNHGRRSSVGLPAIIGAPSPRRGSLKDSSLALNSPRRDVSQMQPSISQIPEQATPANPYAPKQTAVAKRSDSFASSSRYTPQPDNMTTRRSSHSTLAGNSDRVSASSHPRGITAANVEFLNSNVPNPAEDAVKKLALSRPQNADPFGFSGLPAVKQRARSSRQPSAAKISNPGTRHGSTVSISEKIAPPPMTHTPVIPTPLTPLGPPEPSTDATIPSSLNGLPSYMAEPPVRSAQTKAIYAPKQHSAQKPNPYEPSPARYMPSHSVSPQGASHHKATLSGSQMRPYMPADHARTSSTSSQQGMAFAGPTMHQTFAPPHTLQPSDQQQQTWYQGQEQRGAAEQGNSNAYGQFLPPQNDLRQGNDNFRGPTTQVRNQNSQGMNSYPLQPQSFGNMLPGSQQQQQQQQQQQFAPHQASQNAPIPQMPQNILTGGPSPNAPQFGQSFQQGARGPYAMPSMAQNYIPEHGMQPQQMPGRNGAPDYRSIPAQNTGLAQSGNEPNMAGFPPMPQHQHKAPNPQVDSGLNDQFVGHDVQRAQTQQYQRLGPQQGPLENKLMDGSVPGNYSGQQPERQSYPENAIQHQNIQPQDIQHQREFAMAPTNALQPGYDTTPIDTINSAPQSSSVQRQGFRSEEGSEGHGSMQQTVSGTHSDLPGQLSRAQHMTGYFSNSSPPHKDQGNIQQTEEIDHHPLGLHRRPDHEHHATIPHENFQHTQPTKQPPRAQIPSEPQTATAETEKNTVEKTEAEPVEVSAIAAPSKPPASAYAPRTAISRPAQTVRAAKRNPYAPVSTNPSPGEVEGPKANEQIPADAPTNVYARPSVKPDVSPADKHENTYRNQSERSDYQSEAINPVKPGPHETADGTQKQESKTTTPVEQYSYGERSQEDSGTPHVPSRFSPPGSSLFNKTPKFDLGSQIRAEYGMTSQSRPQSIVLEDDADNEEFIGASKTVSSRGLHRRLDLSLSPDPGARPSSLFGLASSESSHRSVDHHVMHPWEHNEKSPLSLVESVPDSNKGTGPKFTSSSSDIKEEPINLTRSFSTQGPVNKVAPGSKSPGRSSVTKQSNPYAPPHVAASIERPASTPYALPAQKTTGPDFTHSSHPSQARVGASTTPLSGHPNQQLKNSRSFYAPGGNTSAESDTTSNNQLFTRFRPGLLEEERMARQIPVFSWSSNLYVTLIPPVIDYGSLNGDCRVVVNDLGDLPISSKSKVYAKYPGPLISSKGVPKTSKKDIEKWVTELLEVQEENALLPLWNLMLVLLRQEEDATLESREIARILDPSIPKEVAPPTLLSGAGISAQGKSSSEGQPCTYTSDIEGLYKQLSHGNRDSALEKAIRDKNWAHAICIALSMGQDQVNIVVKDFVRSEIRSTNLPYANQVAMLYRVFAGANSSAVDEIKPLRNSSLTSLVDETGLMQNLREWKSYIVPILLNRSPNDGAVLFEFGSILLTHKMYIPAHFCMICGHLASNSPPMALIPGISPDSAGREPESLLLAEVYEFVLLTRKDIQQPLTNLLPFKAQLGLLFADMGLAAESQRLAEAALVLAKTYKAGPFIDICELAAQRTRRSTTESKGWITRKLSRPKLDKMWVSSFNKFVSGENFDESAESAPSANLVFSQQDAGDQGPNVNFHDFANQSRPGSAAGFNSYYPDSPAVPLVDPNSTPNYSRNFESPGPHNRPLHGSQIIQNSSEDGFTTPDMNKGMFSPSSRAQQTQASPRQSPYAPVANNNYGAAPVPAPSVGYAPSLAPSRINGTTSRQGFQSSNPESIAGEHRSARSTPSQNYSGNSEFGSAATSPSVKNGAGILQPSLGAMMPPLPSNVAAAPPSHQPVDKTSAQPDDEDDDFSMSTSKPAKDKKSEDDDKDGKDGNKDKKKKGWFGWMGKKEDTTKEKPVFQAKLGGESSFVFDEELKRWVNKNADGTIEQSSLPPPPPKTMSTSRPGPAQPGASGSAMHSSPGLAMPPATFSGPMPGVPSPRTNTPGQGSLSSPRGPNFNGAAPSSMSGSVRPSGTPAARGDIDSLLTNSQAGSRRKKRPARSRYVDVMQQNQ